jgi:hypothetical protein
MMAMTPQHDPYPNVLMEIGRITTTWAKFEHWIDQALWALAKVHDREGACLTSQIQSIHGKFRALQALMIEAQRPEDIQREVASMAGEAALVVMTRNKFAHGPLDMGMDYQTQQFEIYLRHVGVKSKSLTFESVPLLAADLAAANQRVAKLYERLMKNWAQIVGVSRIDLLSPEAP